MAKTPADIVLRQISLPAKKVIRRKPKSRHFPGGIVAEVTMGTRPQVAAGFVQTADLTFPPIQTLPINTSNGGGAIGTGLPVQMIFWGSAWNTPGPNPGAGTIVNAVQSILSGPWMAGLRQYGIHRCNFGGAVVVTNPAPPGNFNDGDVEDLVWALIDDNKFPEPDDPGGRNLYMVFLPPGASYGPGGIRGKHVVASDYDFPFDTDHAWVGFVLFSTALNTILSTFTHELAEMCTDPESDAWSVTSSSVSGNQEIGDVCNAVDGLVNGVNVQSYWSATDNTCLISTAWSVRRALRWSGHVLGGKGLSSIQKPIPSLNKFVVDL